MTPSGGAPNQFNPSFRRVGIVPANTRLVGDAKGHLPNLRDTAMAFMQPITLIKVTQELIDYELKEVKREYATKGTVQPMSLNRLELKPEGERSWKWITLITTPDLVLETAEMVELGGVRYRVMGDRNFTAYGYSEYELVNGYQPPAR